MCGFHLLLKGMLHLFFYLFMESTAFSSETKLQLPSDAFWLVCADLSRTQQHRLYILHLKTFYHCNSQHSIIILSVLQISLLPLHNNTKTKKNKNLRFLYTLRKKQDKNKRKNMIFIKDGTHSDITFCVQIIVIEMNKIHESTQIIKGSA